MKWRAEEEATSAGGVLEASPARAWVLCESLLREGKSCRIAVAGASMHPFLRDGDLAIVSPVGSRRLRRGQVVVARDDASGRMVMHRLMGRSEGNGWNLQGDACPGGSERVAESSIVGVVTGRERAGRALSRLPLMAGCAGGLCMLAARFRVRILGCFGLLKREPEA